VVSEAQQDLKMRHGSVESYHSVLNISHGTFCDFNNLEQAEFAPPIGGLEVSEPHSDFLLPSEVVLFKPSEQEIGIPYVKGRPGKRLIFLNTKLSEAEQEALQSLHDAVRAANLVTEEQRDLFPTYVRVQALRILQQAKYESKKALPIIRTHMTMRVEHFPLSDQESQLAADLKKGLMYWHGRDRKCRPLLVWKMARMNGFDVKRAVNLVLFVLEYGVRYALVPGRVENWILAVDLEGVGLGHNTSANREIAKNIAVLLDQVYCGRNFQTKIFSLPWMIRSIANSFIPADKKDKVQFVSDDEIHSVMAGLFEPHQVERRYGGTAPDLPADQTYPYRFFSNATGQSPDGNSLHTLTDRKFHEGVLCDESNAVTKARWMEAIQEQSLTRSAAEYFASRGAQNVKACIEMQTWRAIVNPEEVGLRPEEGQQCTT
jgi:hypothetical protein